MSKQKKLRDEDLNDVAGGAPVGAAQGSHRVAFEQARYQLDATLPAMVAKKMKQAAFGKLKEAASNVLHLRSPKDSLWEGYAALQSSKKVSAKQQEEEKAAKANYPFMFAEPAAREAKSHIAMMRSSGVEPLSRETFDDTRIALLPKALGSAISAKGTTYVRVPEHALVINSDPKTNTYQFFDPNRGLFTFHNAAEFNEQVVAYIHRHYDGTGRYRPSVESTMDSHLVAPIDHFFRRDLSLESGVCAAMSLHVANWFVRHPEATGTIDATALGLGDFDTVRALVKLADDRERQGNYRTALLRSFHAIYVANLGNPNPKLMDQISELMQGGRRTDAIAMLEASQKKNPDDLLIRAWLRYLTLVARTPARLRPSTKELATAVAFPSALPEPTFFVDLIPVRAARA